MRLSSITLIFIALLQSCSEKKENTENSTSKFSPVQKDNLFGFTFGNVYFEVDSAIGGRISSLKVNDKELLYVTKDSNNTTWGSTFWPSPQSLWGWPPPAILDNNSYTSFLKNDTLILKSEIATLPKIAVEKSFSVSAADTSITIVYTMRNYSDTVIQIAPWEITRVPSGGFFFFPKGSDEPQGDLKKLIKDSVNVTWMDYDSTTIPAGIPKLFADGAEGWIAYTSNSRQLLIKTFPDSQKSMKAPDPENEIELYTHPDKLYVEVEQQGPYTSIPAKGSFSWTVKWYPREIPKEVNIQLGSPSLLSYIRNIVKNPLWSKKEFID